MIMVKRDLPGCHSQRSSVGGRLLAAILSSFCGFAGNVQGSASINLAEVEHLVPGYVTGPAFDMPIADFDGDGLPDVVSVGETNYSDVILILGFRPGTEWTVKQSIVPEADRLTNGSIKLAAWTQADGTHLAFMKDRSVIEYAGWPLAQVHRFDLGIDVYPNDMAVADVDRDGVYEMLIANTNGEGSLRAYSLTTGSPVWDAPEPSSGNLSLLVAQLDADPALEIVLSGETGLVIDGATRAVEWQQDEGIAFHMHAGNYGGAMPRFASLDTDVQMFSAQPWSQLWRLYDIYANSTSSADLDGDGVDELIYFTYLPPRGIRVLDVGSRLIRSTFGKENVVAISAADFDGNGAREIAIVEASGQYSTQPNTFSVMNAASGSTLDAIPAVAPGPYVAGAFIGNADATDIVFASSKGLDYPGALTRADVATGAIRWRSAGAGATIDLNRISNVLVTQIQGQVQPVVLASGSGQQSNIYGGGIVAVNADTGVSMWSISSANGGLPDGVAVNGLAAVDRDGDSLTDSVLACTTERRLRLFDALDQSPVWTSVSMMAGGECLGAFSLIDAAGNLQLVAVLSGSIRAYDAQTHLLTWSLPSPSFFAGASLVPNGDHGQELALFTQSEITFVDVETRAVLRIVDVGGKYPIRAVMQPPGASIHELLAAIDDKLYVFDGVSGAVRAESATVGYGAGQNNRLAVRTNADDTYLIGTGSNVAVFAHRMEMRADPLFQDGFDPIMP